HDALRMLWHAHVGALAAPFVPVFMGVHTVPEEFRQHRYLTAGESSRFQDMRHASNGRPDTVSHIAQGVESTRAATEVFKRLLNLVAQHGDVFLPEVTAVWEAIEQRLRADVLLVQEVARCLLDAGKTELAQDCLTYFCRTELLAALQLAEDLVRGLEARTRSLHGFRTQAQPLGAAQIW
ncbi:MAG: hypothetical protein LH632_00440, partial [Rhodoferax sp.]|nr:hypothetical protein [Rhodoferax sp.]